MFLKIKIQYVMTHNDTLPIYLSILSAELLDDYKYEKKHQSKIKLHL